MIDPHCASLDSAKSLTELYVRANPSSGFAYTIEVLAYTAEYLGYDADSSEFLSLRELELPYMRIHDLRPIALFEKLERLDLSDNFFFPLQTAKKFL